VKVSQPVTSFTIGVLAETVGAADGAAALGLQAATISATKPAAVSLVRMCP
jgi:hypothetical protein